MSARRTRCRSVSSTTSPRTGDCYRQEERTRRGIPDEAVLGGAAQASVDRVAISRALRRHGYLSATRRLVTPPIKHRGAARFP